LNAGFFIIIVVEMKAAPPVFVVPGFEHRSIPQMKREVPTTGVPFSSTMVAFAEPPTTDISPPPYFILGGQTIPPPAPLLDDEPELPLDEVLAWLELPVVAWLDDDDPPVAELLEPEHAPSAARLASARGATKSGRRTQCAMSRVEMKGKVVIWILVSDVPASDVPAKRLPPGRGWV
jgi:hypothetical protein